MGHLPAPGQPFSAGACSLLCETLTAHTFSIPLPCHVLSETTCCHSGPFTGQATTFPFCPLFLSLAPSHFSSSSLLIKLLPTPKHLPLFLPSSLLLPFLLHRALGCSPANCPTSHSLWTLDAPLPSFPLGKILSPSSHSPAHSTSSILFSTQSSLPNKSPHHPTFDGHPSLCPSVPLCCPHHLLRLDP